MRVRDEVLKIVSANGSALGYFSQFWDDEEIVTIAVKNDGYSYRFASNRLRTRELAIESIKSYPDGSKYLIESYKTDKEIMLLIFKYGKCSLMRLQGELEYDPEIVLAAVTYDGSELEYAKYVDEKIVFAAIENNALAIHYAPDKYQNDRNIALSLVKKDGCSIVSLPDYAHRDREIVLLALESISRDLLGDAKSLSLSCFEPIYHVINVELFNDPIFIRGLLKLRVVIFMAWYSSIERGWHVLEFGLPHYIIDDLLVCIFDIVKNKEFNEL